MENKIILNSKQLSIIIDRLCHELIENHFNFSNTILIGLQPRGVFLAKRIHNKLSKIINQKIKYGELDTTFFRDDFRRKKGILTPHETNISFNIENCNVIVIDDVLYTGRTTRSAFDALGSFGRANSIELLVLINRRFSREIPIEPTYVGKSVDVFENEHVIVEWGLNDEESSVVLFNN
ncbi:MAG: bifunctional pyr operon transcriptional regulator/uracil phosphoribosyltransferase PyrR [Bacteroidota bacterium]|nr:bifunctional pyr operon transcriptional regulator/uracil phosphoribosyltransferase PyrR [Bacteroidota bacterium]